MVRVDREHVKVVAYANVILVPGFCFNTISSIIQGAGFGDFVGFMS